MCNQYEVEGYDEIHTESGEILIDGSPTFTFNPFWGYLALDGNSIMWYPNHLLFMSPKEQFERNLNAGHFDAYPVANIGEWDG